MRNRLVLVGSLLGAVGALAVAVPVTDAGLSTTLAGHARPVPGTQVVSAVPTTTTTSPPPSATTTTAPTTTTTTVTTSPQPPPVTTRRHDPTTTRPPDSPPPSPTEQVIDLVNAARADAGCAPVASDPRLIAAAQGHSQDMSARDYFSHTTPEGATFADRIRDAGYPRPAAENIAMGATSAEQVMSMWMNSDGHRRNILNCSLKAIGVGLARDGWYWTQDFGR